MIAAGRVTFVLSEAKRANVCLIDFAAKVSEKVDTESACKLAD